MSQENRVLEYESPLPRATEARFPTGVRLIVILCLLPALVLPFVDYAELISPLDIAARFFRQAVHRWDGRTVIDMLGLYFFVGIPLVLCHLRLLIFGELSKIESWAGYVVVVLGIGRDIVYRHAARV
ncbi:MAG: hypothetical protein FWD61_15595 [Phycisphaerales bacterium]|nr:hypothetical protein [Phycisphaerales bacterium]